MKNYKKIAFRPGKLLIASGLLALLILLCTQKVQADTKDSPYLIKVNRYHNTITVYAKDETGKYNEPVKAITCSVGKKGTETVLGTFKTKEKYRWKLLMGDVWGQYSTRIVGGILFHSVYYYGNCNPSTLAVKEFNKLGTAASHGCIRITVEDAKWIYDNCPVGTTVIIYDDKASPGPLGKPETIKLPVTVRWDPTDPNDKNPYKNKKPTIEGVKNLSVKWGKEADLLKGIKAKSSLGTDITSKVLVNGTYNIHKAGKYNITYSVTDKLGRFSEQSAIVTVGESPNNPILKGIRDQVLQSDVEVTRDLVLSEVTAYCGKIILAKEDIEVTIEEMNNGIYQVTYEISTGKNVTVSKAMFYVDDLAPEFNGVLDRVLSPGQIPDLDYCRMGVTVTDNMSDLDTDDLIITIKQVSEEEWKTYLSVAPAAEDTYFGAVDYDHMNQEGTDTGSETNLDTANSEVLEYQATEDTIWDDQPEEEAKSTLGFLVTYEVEDEVGNRASKTVVFHY